jgi:hypothetical protein
MTKEKLETNVIEPLKCEDTAGGRSLWLNSWTYAA